MASTQQQHLRSQAPTLLSRLSSLEALLSGVHARSRNQHSRSAWYSHFAALRRSVARLIALLSNNISGTEEDFLRTGDMVVVLRDRSVEKWHLAFTQLTADGQFAALGVTLLAALADFAEILGINND